MKGRLAEFVSELFADAPKTRQAHDLREELLSNLQDKYDDLLESGYKPEEAYQTVISNVGDVQELISALDEPEKEGYSYSQEERKRSAVFTTIGIMLLILSPLVSEIFDSIGLPNVFSMAAFFICVAFGVGTLVYNNLTKPEKPRRGDTLVDDFKAYSTGVEQRKRKRGAIISLICSSIVPLYLFISFVTDAWHVTWMMFLLIPLSIAAINVYYAFKD